MAVNQPNLCFVLVSEAVKPLDKYVESLEYSKGSCNFGKPKTFKEYWAVSANECQCLRDDFMRPRSHTFSALTTSETCTLITVNLTIQFMARNRTAIETVLMALPAKDGRDKLRTRRGTCKREGKACTPANGPESRSFRFISAHTTEWWA